MWAARSRTGFRSGGACIAIAVGVLAVAASAAAAPPVIAADPKPGFDGRAFPEFAMPAGGSTTTRRDDERGTVDIDILDKAGKLVASRTLDGQGRPLATYFYDADGKLVRFAISEYGDEPGRVAVERTLSHRAAAERARPGTRRGLYAVNCTNGSYNQDPNAPGAYHQGQWWYQNDQNNPVGSFSLNSASLSAHNTWQNVTDYCGQPDGANIFWQYGGIQARPYVANDGYSMVRFGSMIGTGCGGASAACMSYNSPGNLDVTLNHVSLWAIGAQAGRWDVQSALTHEVGHKSGLRHRQTSATGANVMDTYWSNGSEFASFTTNSTYARVLGLGDARGVNIIW